MAIRLRKIQKRWVALCAAKTVANEGDVYLDDGMHHALVTKFGVDWVAEGFLRADLADEQTKKLMLDTEK